MFRQRLTLLLLCITALYSVKCHATTLQVNSTHTLQAALKSTHPGDTIILNQGLYEGNFRINRSITLRCQPGAILDGQGSGDTLRLSAPNITITGCRIIHWGDDLTAMNAGVYLDKAAANARIENNALYGNVFGILMMSAPSPTLRNNKIQGNEAVRSQDRGNGIHLSNVSGANIIGNEVWHTRDGIYIENSHNNTLQGNTLHHLRYGIHYMYAYHNTITHNKTHHTRTGYAFMQSKYLTITHNQSEHDENYGILLNYITHSTIAHNTAKNSHQMIGAGGFSFVKGAEGKALFIYNSLYNTITDNHLMDSDIGIHLTAGAEDNTIVGNRFIRNKQQVKYVANRTQEWSQDGKGNYWSDYMGWDRDSDGIGDIAYEPNDGVDKMLWKYPSARYLMNSPAIASLRWIQKEFPVLKSVGVKDSYPMMKP